MTLNDKMVIVERKMKTYMFDRPVLPSCHSVPLLENKKRKKKKTNSQVVRRKEKDRILFI